MAKTPRGGTPATLALQAAGVDFVLRPYAHDPSASSYGIEAATKLGVDPARVFKTLVASIDDALAVGIVPVTGSLDIKALASAVGGKKGAMADITMVERATGYVVGGVSPLGQRKPLPTVIDTSAREHATILVSAGRRGLDVELSPGDLVRLTQAITAQIGRD